MISLSKELTDGGWWHNIKPKWGIVDNYGDNYVQLCITRPMLLGEYQHSVDDKGRIAVPAKFRKTLSEGVVVTKGLDGCLYLYPIEEWGKVAEKISQLPTNQADSRAYSRILLAGASHIEIDSQGRILLPDLLRAYAAISSRAVFVGLHNRAEIWDEGKWQQYRSAVEKKTDEIAERLSGFGI